MPLERVFHVDWPARVEAYRRDGYLSLSGCVDPGFLEFLEACLAGVEWRKSHDSGLWYQGVPEAVLREFAGIVSTLTGAPMEKVVLVNNWFLTHFSDHHVAHLDGHWEQVVLLVMLRVPRREPGKESVLKLYRGWDGVPHGPGTRERHRALEADRDRILATEPVRLRSEAGDVILFNASELYHERLFPNGTVHFRLGANTHGPEHPVNRDEFMIMHSSLTPPHPFPERFRSRFPEVRERRYHVAAESPAFRRFWQEGPSLGFRLRRRWLRIESRGRHILNRLAGKAQAP